MNSMKCSNQQDNNSNCNDNNKKRILVANDDSISALGIKRLAAALCSNPNFEVYVVAPREQQSAKSQSITFLREVGVEERTDWRNDPAFQESFGGSDDAENLIRAIALDGTPADCVKWGIGYFKETEGIDFDYVFSGINMGSNVGAAVYYSGTLAATFEGALHGIRSIAMSVSSHDASCFDYVCDELIPLSMKLMDKLDSDTVLSINAPNLPASEIKGVRIVPMAPFNYGEKFCFEKSTSGDYQMTSVPMPTCGELKYDFDCIEAGYASISPITIRISDKEAIERLAE